MFEFVKNATVNWFNRCLHNSKAAFSFVSKISTDVYIKTNSLLVATLVGALLTSIITVKVYISLTILAITSIFYTA